MDAEPIPLKIPDGKTIDTVRLPGLEGEYIHVEADKNALSRYFGQLAQIEGRDPEEARRFFDERVSIGVGTINDIPRYKQSELGYQDDPLLLEKLDSVTESIFIALRLSGDFLACVSPEPNGKYRMTFNTQAVAKALPRGVPHFGKPSNYSTLPSEAKIAYLRDSMQSIVTHESTHLFQAMDNPDLFKYTSEQKVRNRALPLFVLSSAGLPALPMELQPIAALSTGLAMIGGIVYIDKTGKYHKMQQEAHEAQEIHAISNLSNPFIFTVESDPKPSNF